MAMTIGTYRQDSAPCLRWTTPMGNVTCLQKYCQRRPAKKDPSWRNLSGISSTPRSHTRYQRCLPERIRCLPGPRWIGGSESKGTTTVFGPLKFLDSLKGLQEDSTCRNCFGDKLKVRNYLQTFVLLPNEFLNMSAATLRASISPLCPSFLPSSSQ